MEVAFQLLYLISQTSFHHYEGGLTLSVYFYLYTLQYKVHQCKTGIFLTVAFVFPDQIHPPFPEGFLYHK